MSTGSTKKSGSSKLSTRKSVYLWEFLYGLLEDEECSSVISWTSKEEKVFRLNNADELAKLWGTVKNKPKMDKFKLFRAMRTYYDRGMLRKVKGQKGVYQFLSLPYETKECEQSLEAGISHVPTQFGAEENNECRERIESSSSSSHSSKGSLSNGDDLHENVMNDIDQMTMDAELVFVDDPEKHCSDYTATQ